MLVYEEDIVYYYEKMSLEVKELYHQDNRGLEQFKYGDLPYQDQTISNRIHLRFNFLGWEFKPNYWNLIFFFNFVKINQKTNKKWA